jgi:hypothetical protein
MKAHIHWKRVVGCCQIGIVALMLEVWYAHFCSIRGATEYVAAVDAGRNTFRSDFLRVGKAEEETLRMKLLDEYIKRSRKADSLYLLATRKYQSACQLGYAGIIVLAVTTVLLCRRTDGKNAA